MAGSGTLNSRGLRFASKADAGCCLTMNTAAWAAMGICSSLGHSAHSLGYEKTGSSHSIEWEISCRNIVVVVEIMTHF